MRYVSRFKDEHLVEIDELLKDSTNNDPNLRPDIHMFKERLLSWCEMEFLLICSKNQRLKL